MKFGMNKRSVAMMEAQWKCSVGLYVLRVVEVDVYIVRLVRCCLSIVSLF